MQYKTEIEMKFRTLALDQFKRVAEGEDVPIHQELDALKEELCAKHGIGESEIFSVIQGTLKDVRKELRPVESRFQVDPEAVCEAAKRIDTVARAVISDDHDDTVAAWRAHHTRNTACLALGYLPMVALLTDEEAEQASNIAWETAKAMILGGHPDTNGTRGSN